MGLSMTWDDYGVLGQALCAAYPDANYLAISNDELVRLVRSLPEFSGPADPPDPLVLSAVRLAWVAVAEGEDDSGPYDGLA